MKRLIIVVVFLALPFLSGTNKEKTYRLTTDEILVVYKSGYFRGAVNVLDNGELNEDIFKKDSALMYQPWSR